MLCSASPALHTAVLTTLSMVSFSLNSLSLSTSRISSSGLHCVYSSEVRQSAKSRGRDSSRNFPSPHTQPLGASLMHEAPQGGAREEMESSECWQCPQRPLKFLHLERTAAAVHAGGDAISLIPARHRNVCSRKFYYIHTLGRI